MDSLAKKDASERKKHHVGCGVFCAVQPDDVGLARAFIAYTRLTNWASVHQNSDIVKKIVNRDYWEAIDLDTPEPDDSLSFYLFLGLAALAAVLIAVVIILALVRRRRLQKAKTEGRANTPLVDSELEP